MSAGFALQDQIVLTELVGEFLDFERAAHRADFAKGEGVHMGSLNMTLAVVRRVLYLTACEWIDDQGMTWLETAPKIKLFPVKDARSPYPLTREEQGLLFQDRETEGALRPLTKIYNTAWKFARERAADAWAQAHGEPAPEGFRKIRVHDLKHTFGRRLRAAEKVCDTRVPQNSRNHLASGKVG
ncbi:MAG: hypothetical protein ACLPTF_17960 [Steroidobacteraceae bacterium]